MHNVKVVAVDCGRNSIVASCPDGRESETEFTYTLSAPSALESKVFMVDKVKVFTDPLLEDTPTEGQVYAELVRYATLIAVANFIEDGDQVCLGTSYTFKNAAAMTAQHDKLIGKHTVNNKTFSIVFIEHKEQGLAALFDLMMHDDLTVDTALAESRVCTVDIGRKTADFCHTYRLAITRGVSHDIGSYLFFQKVATDISAKTGWGLSVRELEHRWVAKATTLSETDIKHYYNKAVSGWVSRLQETIKAESSQSPVDIFHFCGGGVSLLKSLGISVSSLVPRNVRYIDEPKPSFANTRGLCKVLSRRLATP